MRAICMAVLLVVAGASQADPLKDQGDRYSGAALATRSAVIASNGMAATSQPLATQVALDILRRGGSAADAAIAANAALGLMEPTGSGIGGDLFAIVWAPTSRKLYGLNASGRAPSGQSLKQLRAANGGALALPPHGWLPVTIPGAVDGWFALHAKFGKLPMSDVLAPAIGYAEDGFPLTEYIAASWTRGLAGWERSHAAGGLQEIANARAVYQPGGKAPAEGMMFRNPDLATTYRALGEGGRDAFYDGPLTEAMDGYFRRIGAPHRKSDFAAQHAEWVEPISTNYRGIDVWELPPNSQGLVALEMLNILENFDLKAMGRGSADFWHVMLEAKKLAYEDRARWIADSNKVPVMGLLSKSYAKGLARKIDMQRAAVAITPGGPNDWSKDTIYLTVADKDGMMVSLIQSNYRGMGSGLVPDDGKGRTLGFTFQDRGQQFSLDRKSPNAYAPGKRPFHTIIPAFLTRNGKPLMSFGLMGGDMQPQGHVQIVVNMVDFGMGVQAAGDAARFHHDGSTEPDASPPMADGGTVELETGVPSAIADSLRTLGHSVKYTTGTFGGYQAIWRDPATGIYWGASEFRKDGQAGGF